MAEGVLAPRAEAVDRGDASPVENLRVLAEAGFLGLTTPVEYGGLGVPGRVARDFGEIVAGACGVTAFLLFQHLGACRQVAGGENEALKRELLPLLAGGERFCTLAFSHLRRPGPPAVSAEPVEGGYVFNGTAPWATGWDLAEEVLLAGTLADGRSLWVVAPAVEGEHLRASPPMALCAASASCTVTLTLRDLFVPEARAVKRISREQLDRDTYAGLPTSSMLSLGVAAAATGLLRARGEAREAAHLIEAADALEVERAAAREEVEYWADRTAQSVFPEHMLRARAWCIDLGVRAAHAAVTASGGGANSLNHPAQRLFREALLYTLTGLTPDLHSAVLNRLSRSSEDAEAGGG